MNFDNKYFQKKDFTEISIARYFNNALKDFEIAKNSQHPEVIFKFSYDALTKSGIALIAFCGYKTKSRQGHHIKIIEKTSQILNDKDIEIMGDKMRRKRNLDLYEGGTIISLREAKSYFFVTKKVILESEKYIKQQKHLFEK